MSNIANELQSKFENNHQKAILNILFTANWISSFQNEFFKPFGLSPQQYNILRILRGAKSPLKVQDIKSRMIDRSPNVTRLTDKLIEKALIKRLACKDDRRVVHIEITNKGLELLSQIPTTPNKKLTKQLSNEEAQQLSNLLDKMRNNK